MIKKNRLIFVCLIGLIVSLSFVSSLTASIDKPRMVLYKNYSGEELVFQESVIVNNINNKSIRIEVSPSKEWENEIELSETEFEIKAEESKEVFYNITINSPGLHKGDILVSFIEEGIKNNLVLAQEVEVFVKDTTISSITGKVSGELVEEGSSKIIAITIIVIILLLGLIVIILRLRKAK